MDSRGNESRDRFINSPFVFTNFRQIIIIIIFGMDVKLFLKHFNIFLFYKIKRSFRATPTGVGIRGVILITAKMTPQ